MKTTILLVLLPLFFLVSGVSAQDSTSNWKLKSEMELATRYIWRGLSFSKSPCIQPLVELSKGGFFVSTWGSYTISPEKFQEVDLNIGYSFKSLTLTLSDYFSPIDTGSTPNKYFDYDRKTTCHNYDLQLTYSNIAGSELTIMLSAMIYGAERYKLNTIPTYIELSYNAHLAACTVRPFCGFTTHKGYYADKAAFVNCGLSVSREIQISDRFKMPTKTSLIFNPDKQDVFLIFSLSF